jgi:hypothetical protein
MSSLKKLVALVIVLVALTASFVVVVPPVRASGDLWVSRTPLPILVKDFAAVAVNGKIYAVGYNYTNTNYANTYFYVYDTSSDTWVSKTPMPINQSIFAIATYQNKIYVIGGWIQWDTETIATNLVTGANQVYDIANDSWETKASMPWPRAGVQANVVDGKIYVVGGGLQNGGASQANEAYDPITDSWTEMAPIPTPVSDYASVVVDNKIYVMGGGHGGKYGNAGNLVQIYDPKTNTWASGELLPIPAGDAAAGAIGGVLAPTRIYVVGTTNEYFDLNSTAITQIYDTQTNSWTTGASIPVPAYIDFSIVVVNDTLYAMGGKPFARGVPGLFPAVNEQYFPRNSEGFTPLPSPSSNAPTTSPSPSPTVTTSPSPSPASGATVVPTRSPSTSPSAQPTQSAQPQPMTLQVEFIYAAAGVLIIAIIVAVALSLKRRHNQPNY